MTATASSPDQVRASANVQSGATAPVLPLDWRAQVLLTPFGDGAPPFTTPAYDQLVVAEVSGWKTQTGTAMRVVAYLLEDLQYFDFMFVTTPTGTVWYWLISEPGGPITQAYGPFNTPLVVPAADFLVGRATQAGTWNILQRPCTSWVVAADNPPTYGTWLSFAVEAPSAPFRILNISSQNPLQIPFLGAYFLASIPTFASDPGGADRAAVEAAIGNAQPKDYVNPMVTQQDIQRAFGAPPFPATTCTLSQIQAVIPGIRPLPNTPLPQWPERLKSTAWDIGLDFIPYDTTIWYRFDWELQRTSLIGLASGPGQGTYQDRSDNVLYASAPATNPIFKWNNGQWQHTTCGELAPVGVPAPDWLAKGDTPGRIRATIADNANFGLAPGESLNLISKIRPRDPPILSLFWVWFTDDGQGVCQRGELFSECEFAPEPQHQIVLVDYVTFERHSNTIVRSDFDDPCPRSAHGSEAAGLQGSGV